MSQDSKLGGERPPRPSLVYPFDQIPGPGEAVQICSGVHWIRMPMPGPLSHINLWAVDDEEGIALFDTGMRTDEVAAAWQMLFSRPPLDRALSRVLITHMHPDHVGMAGWLVRRFRCRMWMTRQEYLYCRALIADSGREAPDDAIDFYRRAGWSQDALDAYRARFGNFGKRIHPLPESFRRIQDGDVISVGGNDWHIVVGTGHSPEHACFYCPTLKILISGDQVLPRISSNISVHPTEPDANPMGDWLASLRKLSQIVPDDVLVLPAHNEPFRGLHSRLEHLERSQLRTLQRLLGRLEQPRRVIDTFVALFGRDIPEKDGLLLNLATGEAAACLNYLQAGGTVSVVKDRDGVAWYSTRA